MYGERSRPRALHPSRALRHARRRRHARGVALCTAALLVTSLAGIGSADASGQHPAPTNLRITPDVGALSATWGVTSTSALAGFRISWRARTKPAAAWGKAVELPAGARRYVISGLRSAPYEVLVRTLYTAVKGKASTKRRRAPKKLATSKKLGGSIRATATPLSGGGEPPPKEEPPKEEEQKKEKHQEPPKEEQPSCTLYAAPSGSDSNSGAPGAPVRNVAALLAKLSAGQTGCLNQGSYAGFSVHSGQSHGRQGGPVTITSTNPATPATISGRVSTLPGADWLTFSHLLFTDSEVRFPSISIGSAHTAWLWDDVSAAKTICFEPSERGAYGPGEDTLIEHDRIHNCGQPFTCDTDAAPCNEPPNNGYFIHGVYDLGVKTTIRNSYVYDNSSKGVLLRGGGGAVVEHNVIDGNGSGVIFGDLSPENDTFAWNIVTGSSGVCGSCFEYYGIWSYGSVGSGDVARNNDVFGNSSANIGPHQGVTLAGNVEVDPQYVNAAKHEYDLKPSSPVQGYGPEGGEAG